MQQLSHNEFVLYLQCLNEVLRGFSVENFEQTLCVSKPDLTVEDRLLRDIERSAGSDISIPEVPLRYEVIKVTMGELGESEFQTRTGFDLSEAESLLKKSVRSF